MTRAEQRRAADQAHGPLVVRTMTGRCADGAERDGGRLLHFVGSRSHRSLCGRKPGRLSSWSAPRVDVDATCPRCLGARRWRSS